MIVAHRTLKVLILILAVFLAGACGSDRKETEKKSEETKPAPAAGKAPSAAASESVDVWDEYPDKPFKEVTGQNPNLLPPDPDVVVERYNRECPAGPSTPQCKQLRRQVERAFLSDLVALRAAGEKIDRRWYRVAARSEVPQLACIGLRELIYAKDRTPEEDSLIVAAMDSPWPDIRDLIMSSSDLPVVKESRQRAQTRRTYTGTTCVSAWRESEPGRKWAGNYPGAKFRFFASSESLRWFTTPDPVEKVLAYFNSKGKKALTMEEIGQAQYAKYMEEMNRITASPDPDDEQKLMEVMQQMTQQTNWSAPFQNIQGIGEIRYVMLSPKQAIAIFRDDVLHGTSIVASRPPYNEGMNVDIEKAKREMEQRAFLGI